MRKMEKGNMEVKELKMIIMEKKVIMMQIMGENIMGEKEEEMMDVGIIIVEEVEEMAIMEEVEEEDIIKRE